MLGSCLSVSLRRAGGSPRSHCEFANQTQKGQQLGRRDDASWSVSYWVSTLSLAGCQQRLSSRGEYSLLEEKAVAGVWFQNAHCSWSLGSGRAVGQFQLRSLQLPVHLPLRQSLTAQHTAREQGAVVRAKGFGCRDDRGGSSCKMSAWRRALPAEDPTASALSSGRTVRGV